MTPSQKRFPSDTHWKVQLVGIKEIPQLSKLGFLETFLTNVAPSDAKDNTSGSLNRGSIADLPLLRTY